MKTRAESGEVLYPAEAIVAVGAVDLAELKRLAFAGPNGRARLCAHASATAGVQEMFIALAQKSYVRPHRHVGRSESVHIIEGEADLILFDDDGAVASRILLGPPGGRGVFFHRLDTPCFHTVLVRSELVLFHEVVQGPFERARTVFPDWAPDGADAALAAAYTRSLSAAPQS